MSSIDQSNYINDTSINLKAKSNINFTNFDDKNSFLSLIRLQRIVKKFMTKNKKNKGFVTLTDKTHSGPFFSKSSKKLTNNNQKLIETEVNAGILQKLF